LTGKRIVQTEILPEAIVFLDVEASGLGEDTYPIEVGWAYLKGSSGSMLIRPAPDWTLDAWDPFAEEIHGISWDQLHREGLVARDVADQLSQVLSRASLILSDAHQQDSFWLSRLFEETPEQRTFELSDERTARHRYFGAAPVFAAQDGMIAQRDHRAESDARVRSQSRCQRPPIVDVNGPAWYWGRPSRQTSDCRWAPGFSDGVVFNRPNFVRQTLSECERVR
jgi:hypothetical protein